MGVLTLINFSWQIIHQINQSVLSQKSEENWLLHALVMNLLAAYTYLGCFSLLFWGSKLFYVLRYLIILAMVFAVIFIVLKVGWWLIPEQVRPSAIFGNYEFSRYSNFDGIETIFSVFRLWTSPCRCPCCCPCCCPYRCPCCCPRHYTPRNGKRKRGQQRARIAAQYILIECSASSQNCKLLAFNRQACVAPMRQ